jgi:hypothetical protein
MLCKRFIALLGLFLGSYVAAAAQRPSQQVTVHEPSAPLPTSAFSLFQNRTESSARLDFTVAESREHDRSLASIFPIEHFRTVFVTESRLSFAQIWSGRLQLGCFASTLHTGNIMFGPSALSEPRAPGRFDATRPVSSYGLSLRFSFGPGTDSGHVTQLWRNLSQIVSGR